MDKRKFTRILLKTKVIVHHGTTAIEGESENLSFKGLYVKMPPCIAVGEAVELDVPIKSNGVQSLIKTKARVVRLTKNGIAFEFSIMDAESFSLLEYMIFDEVGIERRLMMEVLGIVNHNREYLGGFR